MNRQPNSVSAIRLLTFLVIIVCFLFASLGLNNVPPANAQNAETATPTPTGTPDQPRATPLNGAGAHARPIPSQMVIRFKSTASEQEKMDYVRSFGGVVKKRIARINAFVVRLPKNMTTLPAPDPSIVEGVEQDYYIEALDLIPNDPRYPEQWALPAIGAPSAWDELPADAPKVTVAVIDSGICASHPDLAGRIEAGWDFLENDDIPQDDFGHGCSVAGIIAANMNDSIGIAGVAPNAQIMPLRVLNGSGVGSYSDVAAAIVYAADNGAQVINLSLGGSNPSSMLENAVNYAISKGVIVVAAAGNNGTEGALYPAAYPDVIAVGSVDPNLQHSSFSNYGSQIDIWAPGRDILTTKRDGSYGLVSGTSFAAPYVAGAKAISYAEDRNLIMTGGIILSLIPEDNQEIDAPTPTVTESVTAIPITATPKYSGRQSFSNMGIEVDIPSGWDTNEYQNVGFGFSFLSPKISFDENGDIANGAYITVRLYKSALLFDGVQNRTLFVGGDQATEYLVSDKNIIRRIIEISHEDIYYYFTLNYNTTDNNEENYNETFDNLLATLVLISREGEQPIKTLQDELSSLDLSHSALTFPFLAGVDWKVASCGGYNNSGSPCYGIHGGSQAYALYALDFLLSNGDTGGYAAIAPTGGFISHIEHSNTWNQSPKCIDISIDQFTNGTDLYIQICHVDIESYLMSGNKSLGQGQYLGKVATNGCAGTCDTPHIHIAAFVGQHGNPWVNPNTMIAVPFKSNFLQSDYRLALDGVSFTPTGTANEFANSGPYRSSIGGWCPGALSEASDLDLCNPGTSDTIPPSGSWSSPGNNTTISSSNVTLTVTASDNSGGSGVREVRWSAKWGGNWYYLGNDTSSPYSMSWNMCNSGVPNGDVELGFEVWDNANNKWVYSEHYTNYHINKNYNCSQSGNDTTPPTGSWTSPSNGATINSSTVTLSVNASDNTGGSGVKEVRWSAKWNNQWFGVGEDSSAPYSIDWNMCNSGVPNGDVELGMEVWDNANNKWVYSEHYSNIHINKNYDCGGNSGGGDPLAGGPWNTQAWMNKYLAGYTNWEGTFTWDNGNYPYIYFDWGAGAPFSGWGGDEFSMRLWRNVYFPGGSYQFITFHDDGVRLWVDGNLIIDNWWDSRGETSGGRDLSAGYHEVKVEYYENRGDAALQVKWYGPGYPRPDNDPPDGRITSPAHLSATNSSTLNISADAWDDVSGVDRVEFYAWYCYQDVCDWRYLGADYSSPYTYSWNWGYLPDLHVWLRIDVYDKTGKSRGSAGNWVEVDLDRVNPTASITSPAVNTFLSTNQITISASANDDRSGVQKVQFFAGYNETAGAGAQGEIEPPLPIDAAESSDVAAQDYWHEIGWDENGGDGWNITWNSSAVPDQGGVAFFVYAYDKAGNYQGAQVWPISLDRVLPASSVDVLPAYTGSTSFPVSWTGYDATSGVASYDIQYQDNGGNWTDWLSGTTSTSSTFYGATGHTYAFRSRARDRAGNVEDWPVSADAQTTLVVAPTNDNFPSAIAISAIPYTHTVDTRAATTATDDPIPTCGYGKNSNSVWYKYTAPANGLLEIDTWESEYDTVLAVWRGTQGSLTQVACNDDIYGYLQAWIGEIPVTASTTYYIEVMDYGNPGGGNLKLYVNFAATPSNDDFNSPITISSMPYNTTQDVRGATQASDDPSLTACNRLPGSNSVWYKYTTSTLAGQLDLDTIGSTYDTMLAVWTGTRGNLTLIGCNDDIGYVDDVWDTDSTVTVQLQPSTTYYIEVSEYNGIIDINGASATGLNDKPEQILGLGNVSGLEEMKSAIDRGEATLAASQDPRGGDVGAQLWGGQLQLHANYHPVPGSFNKTSPGNAATNVSLNPTLSWGSSSNAASYEYCYDTTNDNACSTWISAGASTSVTLSGLEQYTTFYWQVRAINASGSTYANGGGTVFWSFTTGGAPGAFGRSNPSNGTANQPPSLTLSWSSSSNVVSYEYCYDTSDDNACSSWVNNGASTSKVISGLSPSTTYYWHVRAINSFGATYADGISNVFWSFTTGSAPIALGKTSPVDGVTNQPLSLTLNWGTSSNATSYEYCYDTTNDNNCSSWTNNGTSTSKTISGLSQYTTYYWHVRAVNNFGATYSDGATTAFWSFTTGGVPGTFGKSSPFNGATSQPLSLTLAWGASNNATSYEYCYDTTNDNACSSWTSNGTNTSVDINGLNLGTNYYWHVRAINSFGTTYSNGNSAAFWSFTTGSKPGSFAKSNPDNGAVNQSLTPTLAWGSSNNAVSYEYCFDTTNDNTCDNWTSSGTAISATLSGLDRATTYYWQVRANNGFGTTYADGSETSYRSFTTIPYPPGNFGKSAPANDVADQPTSLTLSWQPAAGAASYDYCYDTTNDNSCASWSNTTSTSRSLTGLAAGTTYYWQVRAKNSGGTIEADLGDYWSFTTLPSAANDDFNVPIVIASTPFVHRENVANATTATDDPTLPCVSAKKYQTVWYRFTAPSNGILTVDTFGSQYDTVLGIWTGNRGFLSNKACNDDTSGTQSLATVSVTGGVTYHIEVANYSSTSAAPNLVLNVAFGAAPSALSKTNPANGSVDHPTSLILSWEVSDDAASYEYCYDTSNDNACSSWTSTGTAPSVNISNLVKNTTYYWQVRANNSFGTTYANNGAWWSFKTEPPPPDAFTKSAPANGATDRPTSITLAWVPSSSATAYQYCYDTTDDNACAVWVDTTVTSVNISGLDRNTTYYWQVRASNSKGAVEADEGIWWAFTTLPPAPEAFSKSSPANASQNNPTGLTLSWNPSDGAASYDYCYDTTNDNACANWVTTPNTSASISGLANAATYYWQVRATNAGGTTYADNNAWWLFTIIPPPPGAFNKLSPVNGAFNQPTTLILDWSTSSYATSYEYCYDTTDDSACSGDWISTTASNATINNLQNNTTYYWHVRARNSVGAIDSNPNIWWSFRTQLAQPNLLAPANGENLLSRRPTFEWENVPGAASYNIQVSTSNSFSTTVINAISSVPSYTHSADLNTNTLYYWRVNASGPNGSSPWSEIRSFRTPNPPPAPTLSAPASNALITASTVKLDWNNVSMPAGTTFQKYVVQVATNTAFTANLFEADAVVSEYNYGPLTPNTVYYWRVRAYNTFGQYGAWSAVRAFRAAILPPALDTPLDGDFLPTRRPTFTWQPVDGATGYTIEASTSAAFGTKAINATINTATITYTHTADLAANTLYYWRVKANGPNGPSAYSEVRTFRTGNPPSVPTLSAPANNALVTTTSPLFDWANSTVPPGVAFDHYQIQVATSSAFTTIVHDHDVTGIANSQDNTAVLDPATTYYWRVRSWSAAGHYSGWSAVRSIRIAYVAPILLTPANGSIGVPSQPTFTWTLISGATSYTLHVSKSSSFSILAINKSIPGTTYTHTLNLAPGLYYWRVRANGLYGPGAWSVVFTFTVP